MYSWNIFLFEISQLLNTFASWSQISPWKKNSLRTKFTSVNLFLAITQTEGAHEVYRRPKMWMWHSYWTRLTVRVWMKKCKHASPYLWTLRWSLSEIESSICHGDTECTHFESKLDRVFKKFKCGEKLNDVFGFVLNERESNTLMERSKLLATREDLVKTECFEYYWCCRSVHKKTKYNGNFFKTTKVTNFAALLRDY